MPSGDIAVAESWTVSWVRGVLCLERETARKRSAEPQKQKKTAPEDGSA